MYHTVKPGENLYRIGRRYGVPTQTLVRANRIADVREISVGTRLFVPRSGAPPARRQPAPTASGTPRGAGPGDLRFAWPVRGKLSSGFGRRGGRPHEGIDVSAPRGTPIRAAEAGRVIHSGRLGDYGRVVIVKHAGHYRSVYAHVNRAFVSKGAFVNRGQRIAEVGTTGNATGPHLHFEIREGKSARNPMRYLP